MNTLVLAQTVDSALTICNEILAQREVIVGRDYIFDRNWALRRELLEMRGRLTRGVLLEEARRPQQVLDQVRHDLVELRNPVRRNVRVEARPRANNALRGPVRRVAPRGPAPRRVDMFAQLRRAVRRIDNPHPLGPVINIHRF